MPADKKENPLVKLHCLVGFKTKEKLDQLVQEKKLPMSFLIALAIEGEFQKSYPFSYDVSIPEGDYEEYTFVDQATKILNYMKNKSGMSLEMMTNLRDDIGIPDRETFLLAFSECLNKGFLDAYHPRQNPLSTVKYDQDFLFYRIKGTGHKAENKTKRQSKQYEEFIRLKKKYEGK